MHGGSSDAMHREKSGIAIYGNYSDVITSDYTRVVYTTGPQIIFDDLSKLWALSFPFEGLTNQDRIYLDVRICFVVKNSLYKFHLIATPLLERHTEKARFDTIGKPLDAVSASWRDSIISVYMDTASYMTGRISNLTTRIPEVWEPGLIRVWCGLHQLDLVTH